MPLSFPTLASNPNFQSVATWLTQASSALVAEGNAALDSLKEIAAQTYTAVPPDYSQVVWLAGLGPSSPPIKPTLRTINLDSVIAQIQGLSPPDTPTVSFNYNDPGYDSVLRNTVADKILFDLLNGGYGIDTNDEQALFNRARDREAQLLSENEENVLRQNAATGFPLPQGALYKQLDKARQEYVSKMSGVNRDIALERARLFVENRRQVIAQALQHEAQGIELYNAMQNRLLLAARTSVEMAIFLYDAGIRLFQARLTALTEQAKMQLEINTSALQLYSSEISAYATLINALRAQAEVDLANSRNVSERDLRVYESRVKQTEMLITQTLAQVEIKKDIAKYLTEFFRTALGSAMNGINGLAVQTGDAPAASPAP